jgi:hypothetical protein
MYVLNMAFLFWTGQEWHDEILHRNTMQLSGTGDESILIEAGPQMYVSTGHLLLRPHL